MLKTGIELITQERWEQIEIHGRTITNDVFTNSDGQLRIAAELLLAKNEGQQITTKEIIEMTPKGWEKMIWFRMYSKNYEERLIIAGALIAAEIDRIQSMRF